MSCRFQNLGTEKLLRIVRRQRIGLSVQFNAYPALAVPRAKCAFQLIFAGKSVLLDQASENGHYLSRTFHVARRTDAYRNFNHKQNRSFPLEPILPRTPQSTTVAMNDRKDQKTTVCAELISISTS